MNTEKLPIYEFEGFRLDPSRKHLWYGDERVSLTPKSLETLIVLVRNRQNVVEKELIFDEVWADTFVEESTLAQNIRTLRRTLGQFQSETEFIATVPRRGYRFVARVQEVLSDEEIVVVEKHTRTHIVADRRHIHDSNDALAHRPQTTARKFGATRLILGGAAAGLFLMAGLLAFRYFFPSVELAESSFHKFRLDTLAVGSEIKSASLSPNSKYLALIEDRADGQALVLRQIENGNKIEVVPKINGRLNGTAFAPDGERIYYTVYENSEPGQPPTGALYKVPLLGGASQRVLQNIDSPAALSPDNKRIAFIRRNVPAKETALVVTDLEGANERIVAVRKFEEGFTVTGPGWSPDGKLLSATVNHTDERGRSMQIAVIDIESGTQKVITRENWLWAGQTVWLKDGSGLVVVAFGAKSPNINDEIWLAAYPSGKARPVTNGVNGILGISLSSDSNAILAVKSNKVSNFLTASLDDPARPNSLLTKTGDDSLLPLGADWLGDDEIVYSATQNGNADLWKINAVTAETKQLTSDASGEIWPRVSKDGRFMIFLSNRSGSLNVWRSNTDGTNPKQLTDNEALLDATLTPDGQTVFFIGKAAEGPRQVLWKVSANGENATQMTSLATFAPRVSPDGQTIACFYQNPEARRMMPALLSTENAEVVKFLNAPRSDIIPLLEWAPDGKNLYLVLQQNKLFALWSQPLDDRPAVKLHEWPDDSIFRFAVSKNGKRIFYEKGIETNTVILLSDLSGGE